MSSPLKVWCAAALLALVLVACQQGHPLENNRPAGADRNLGNLRCGPRPSPEADRVIEFLFGTEPEPPTLLVKPMQVVADGADLLISDGGLNRVLRWRAADFSLVEHRLTPPPAQVIALAASPDGLLVVDAGAAAVIRYDAAGQERVRYSLETDFRPADAVVVGGQVWVSNTVAHSLERFDFDTAGHLGTIGARGDRPGAFGLPLGLATSPDGNVCVVDMLNARVQILDPAGRHVRTIGGPGSRPGAFGRPKDVAVAADGTIFVSDAATQSVQAFDASGSRLGALGLDGVPLSVPSGLAVIERIPPAAVRDGTVVAGGYFVLVAEQLAAPGLRVFHWTPRAAPRRLPRPTVTAAAWTARNPHWDASACGTCHAGEAQPTAGPRREIDTSCLQCHDGTHAPADPHPLAAIPSDGSIRIPDGWPLVEGRLGCLSCHDIARHCDQAARRPADNAAMLRWSAIDPLDGCRNCHVDDPFARANPHEDTVGCATCHTTRPAVRGRAGFGDVSGTAELFDNSSGACLRCHVEHWDYAPGGHLGQHVPTEMRQDGGTFLPLRDGRITCYTCHNPHPPGEAGGVTTAHLLRAAQPQLCGQCHRE